MPYLRNTWYLSAWANELQADKLLARVISEIPLVLFREASGTARALLDRCPHRFAPLSAGKLAGGVLRCGYHGLAFGADGSCVENPHGAIPRAARVRAFPVCERHQAIWIWTGEPSLADATKIPDLGFIDNYVDSYVYGYLETAANYQLMIDNIMDLTHADYLHPTSLGGGINQRAKSEVTRGDSEVSIKWSADNDILAPAMDCLLPIPGQRADFRNEVYWTPPGHMRHRVAFAPTGLLAEGPTESWAAHVMTPQNEKSTHYFYCVTGEMLRANPALRPVLADTLRGAFQGEDAPMLEAQQRCIGEQDFWSLKPVLLPNDKGAALARRTLDAMIAEEQKQTSAVSVDFVPSP